MTCERIGGEAVVARHMPFAIGIDEALRERLLQNFFQTADVMRDQPG